MQACVQWKQVQWRPHVGAGEAKMGREEGNPCIAVGSVGELSAARQVLKGAELAPGTLATLHALTDLEKMPPLQRSPSIRSHVCCSTFVSREPMCHVRFWAHCDLGDWWR